MKAFLIVVLFLLVFILFASKSMERGDLSNDSVGTVQAAVPMAVTMTSPAVVPMAVSTAYPLLVVPVQPTPTTAIQNTPLLPVTGRCQSPYTVQPGDTLFRIAVNCSTTLAALTQANPQITNTNLIFPGQLIIIPNGSPAAIPITGMAAVTTNAPQSCPCDAAAVPVTGLKPGSMLQVTTHNFPPNEPVNIALGRQTGGYTVVASGVTDTFGSLTTQIVVPYASDSRIPWVVMVLTTTTSPLQVTSQLFYIGL